MASQHSRYRWMIFLGGVLSLLALPVLVSLWIGSNLPYPWITNSLDKRQIVNFTKSDPRYWVISESGTLTFCGQSGKDWQSPQTVFKIAGMEYAVSRVGKSFLWNLIIPYWILICLTFPIPMLCLFHWRKDRVIRLRGLRNQCLKCGYDLRAHRVGDLCPECGTGVSTK